MEQYPLFTVIIPQKNRAEYLIHTLRTCMIQDYPNCEFIVADDCSDDNSAEMIRGLMKRDPRIKLIAHDHHVGMRDNFESALAAVRPGFVMALGGDDGLVPGCFWKMHEIIKETGTQLLCWTTTIFTYPDNENKYSKFIVRRRKGLGYKWIKSEDFLNKIATTFSYQIPECPMFYMQGVASTELVDRVKSRTPDGCFYYCPTPDGFSGVVLAGEVEKYVFTNQPLAIVGNTTKSQGRNYQRNDEKSKQEAQEFFNDNIRRTMHPELASQPYSPLQTLMTADYLLTARDLPGWPGKFKMFKFEDLLHAAFRQMERGWSIDVLERELNILHAIAEQHGLLPLFEQLYKSTLVCVNRNKDDVFSGLIVTKQSVIFPGEELGINNIYDAALASSFAVKLYNILSVREAFTMAKRAVRTVVNRFNIEKKHLPNYRRSDEICV
jgi:glycosyltransferase involved in cell wall biosynthesis